MKPNPKTRILVADDHFVVRTGLIGGIHSEPDMTVVAEASNGREAVELFKSHLPDVAIMDLRMPQMTGLEATDRICAEFPSARIVIFSFLDAEEDVYRALQAGARSYLLKTALGDQIITAIRTVAAGEFYLPEPISRRLAQRVKKRPLTSREMEVLASIIAGRSNKEIGASLSIAEVTVKQHITHIFSKLHVQDRTQAAVTALRRGILHLDQFDEPAPNGLERFS